MTLGSVVAAASAAGSAQGEGGAGGPPRDSVSDQERLLFPRRHLRGALGGSAHQHRPSQRHRRPQRRAESLRAAVVMRVSRGGSRRGPGGPLSRRHPCAQAESQLVHIQQHFDELVDASGRLPQASLPLLVMQTSACTSPWTRSRTSERRWGPGTRRSPRAKCSVDRRAAPPGGGRPPVCARRGPPEQPVGDRLRRPEQGRLCGSLQGPRSPALPAVAALRLHGLR